MRHPTWKRALTLLAGSMLLLGPAHFAAGGEPLALYEDWKGAPTIRSDRWNGGGDFGHEIERFVKDERLVMRFRREGGTSSDSGSTGFFSNRLMFANPGAVDSVEAELKVRDLVVTGCPANPTSSTARAVRLDQLKFSDLDPAVIRAPGDRTGDYIARVRASRTSNSTAPDGIMDVTAQLFRCNDAPCAATTTIAAAPLGQVAVGEKFRMSLAWDALENQFRAAFNNGPEVSLPYNPAVNRRSGNGPFVILGIQQLPANCTVTSGGPTVGDAEIEMREVRTNASAVIP
jgi:hypothetical protein